MQRSIPEEWIKRYVDQLLKAAQGLEPGAFRDAVVLRAEHVMDLVEAFRKSSSCEGP